MASNTTVINKQQDRQCTHNGTLKCVHVSLLPGRNNKYYICKCARARVCVCVRGYSLPDPAGNAIAPHCDVICGLWLHQTFRHYLIYGILFGKKITEHTLCVFDFLYNFCLARYCHKCENVFM